MDHPFYVYYSIDYIGLNAQEKIEKLVSLFPCILTTKRFHAIAEQQAANYIRKQIVWGARFPSLSKFKIIDAANIKKLKGLERN